MKLNRFILVVLFISTILKADELESRFNYFGNAMVSKLDNSNYTLHNYNTDNIDNKVRIVPNSKLGIQYALYNDKWTFITQVVGSKNHGKYVANLAWLNAKYNINENYYVRIGKIQTPFLLSSDTRSIDYLQLWTKMPGEIDRVSPVESYTGIEFSYQGTINDEYDFNIVVLPLSKSNVKINTNNSGRSNLKVNDANSIVLSLNTDDLKVKTSYSQMNFYLKDNNVYLKTIKNRLTAYGYDMSKYSMENKKFEIYTFSVGYNYEDYILQAEIVRLKADVLYPSKTAGYAMLGYRYESFTPYFIYSRSRDDTSHFNTDLIVPIDATSTALKSGLNQFLYSAANSSEVTKSIGLNYSLSTTATLKLQMDKTTFKYNGTTSSTQVRTYGTFEKNSGIEPDSVYTYTMSISFAF